MLVRRVQHEKRAVVEVWHTPIRSPVAEPLAGLAGCIFSVFSVILVLFNALNTIECTGDWSLAQFLTIREGAQKI